MLEKQTDELALIFFPAFDWCISPTHPEREERLLFTRDQILEEGLFDHEGIKEYRPRLATKDELLRTHVFIPSLEKIVTESHLIAAGGSILASDLVLEKKAKRAFALLRPPGHHSNKIVHGTRGFCTINNEAIVADHLRKRLGKNAKIAIIDTDAHHGDGTQDIFYNDPGILHISLHQDGRTLYPGTGFLTEQGGPGAFGQTVNIPLPPGTGDQGMLLALEKVVLPVLEDFQPDFIINGAGQDNHFSDPLTNMNFTAQGYARLTELLKPDLVILEGGYSIETALPYVNLALILALAGLDYSKVQEPTGKPRKEDRTLLSEVERICDEALMNWRRRAEVDLKEIFGQADFYQRVRNIHYDTDGIMESQTEYIRLCENCPGWRGIYTSSNRNPKPTAVLLSPWQSCENCQGEAKEQWQTWQKQGEFEQVVWQNLLRVEVNG